MRAARKCVGLNQVEIAQRLGISQSALSKLENGLLVPSAPQWFDFCKISGIVADTLVTGYIERNTPALIESHNLETSFKLARRYRENRGSKARAMLPFLSYFSGHYGEEGLEKFLHSIQVDPDLFMDLDNQINLNFCIDISKQLIRDGRLKPKDIPALAKAVNNPQNHGSLNRFYDGAEGAINRLKVLLLNARYYECNFEYVIEDIKRGSIEFSVKPNRHLADFDYRDEEIGNFFCLYKRHYFEAFANRGDTGTSSVLTEKQCHYHGAQGAEKCVYHLKIA